MMLRNRHLSRRSFLRGMAGGLAISLALPPLEAMFDLNGAFADGQDDDPFFGVFYWANGTTWHGAHGAEQGSAGHPDLWTPSQTGAGFTASELLEPLMRHQVSVMSGLEPHTDIPAQPGGQSDGHMRGFMVGLTGDRPRPEGFDHGSHTLTALRSSLDQYVARHPGFYTTDPTFRSLEVGVSEARFHDYGHWNAISFNGPDSTNLPIMQPSALFDRLFNVVPSGASDSHRRGLLLDAVLSDAQSLRRRLGQRDRERLEAHLEHLDGLRRRVDAITPQCNEPPRPSDSGDLRGKSRTMAELLALAVNCRLTRVFSFMLTSPASTHVFSNLGVPDGMHKTCHDGHWERVRAVTRYQMEIFSDLLDAFQIPNAVGDPLLSRGCIYGTSEYGEGWKHSVKEFPVVIAGSAGGRLNGGIHVREAGGNLSRAQLTALRGLGIDVPSFGWNGGQTTDAFDELLS